MAGALVIRRQDGVRSSLGLDGHPRELRHHPGFKEEDSARPCFGSLDPVDALEGWAERLAADWDHYVIAGEDHRVFCLEKPLLRSRQI